MTYVKQTWKNLPDQSTPITAERLSHMETQYDAAMIEVRELDRATMDVVNLSAVMEREGLGFEAALRLVLSESGSAPRRIILPTIDVTVDEYFDVPNNTHIVGQGADTVMRKTGRAVVFRAYRKSNFSLSHITFEGKIASGGGGITALWAINSNNWRVDSIHTRQSVGNGHVLDLQGCSDWVVSNSSFSGKLSNEKHYSEAIQIDNSVITGAIGAVEEIVFDGAACDNGLIIDCKALAEPGLKAPKLVGSHSAVHHRPHGTIRVVRPYQEATPIPSDGSGGWLTGMSFVNTRNVIVEDAVFNFEQADVTLPDTLFQLHTFGSGIALDKINTPGATNTPFEGAVSGVLTVTGTISNGDTVSKRLGGYLNPVQLQEKTHPVDTALPRLYVYNEYTYLFYSFRVNAADFQWAVDNMQSASLPVLQLPKMYAPPMRYESRCVGPRGGQMEVKISEEGVVLLGYYRGVAGGFVEGNLYFKITAMIPRSA